MSDLSTVQTLLSAHHPFDLLPAPVLAEVAAAATLRDFPAGAALMRPGDMVDTLYVVRTGAVETRDPDNQLLARLGEGECAGVRALLRGGKAVNTNVTIEDSSLVLLPAALFERLRREHRSFAYFFAAFDGGRLGDSLSSGHSRDMDLMSKRVSDLLSRGPVTVPPAATIQDAARLMRAENVSSVLVVDGSGILAGILTDRDLRNKVVAEGMNPATPVARVMTPEPRCIQAGDYLLDAMLTMSRHGIHHLPVMADGKVAGCLTTSTVVDSHSASPLFLARSIHGAEDVGTMAAAVARVPDLVETLAGQGASARDIGHVVTALTDAVTTRMVQMAEAELGPAPVPYAWVAAGSQARYEQTALSDQDNCLIIDDAFDPARHGDYFRAFSRKVCDGLAQCGYVHCPGEMMAMTDQWRQKLSVWRNYFRRWIEEPEPKALMLSSVFFDMRLIGGEPALFEDLNREVLEKGRKNRIFQSYMAVNALTHRPPLGLFRNLVLISGGEHDHTLDLKHSGIVPIVDLARVYALAGGIGAVNTADRLLAAREAKVLSADGAQDLADALDFIGLLRLRHQARLIREGKKADNYLPPEELSSFERNHLKGAFGVIKTMQSALATSYQLSRF